jgi:hypothetical protein
MIGRNVQKHLKSIVAAALLAGCATGSVEPQKPRPKHYTKQEHGRLTYCVGMADTAQYVATSKLRGAPIERVKSQYDSKPNTRLHLATVDKVYGASFTSAWDYTVSFFKECAQELAHVPASRADMAAYCMQNGMIADVAHTYKNSGAPREKAYTHFAQFGSKTPKSIVDWVYASSKGRAEIKLEVWNTCMSEITESS